MSCPASVLHLDYFLSEYPDKSTEEPLIFLIITIKRGFIDFLAAVDDDDDGLLCILCSKNGIIIKR